jgi:hypothetical protein
MVVTVQIPVVTVKAVMLLKMNAVSVMATAHPVGTVLKYQMVMA